MYSVQRPGRRGMLIAISELNGARVLASEVDRKHPCRCPECRESLVYKAGALVVQHFAHYARTDCSLSEGESIRHHQMKLQLARYFKRGHRVELEWEWVVGRRADIVLPDASIVIECQASPISLFEWEARTLDYNRHGTAVLWVWDISRMFGNKTVTRWPPFENEAEDEYRVPAEIRWCSELLGETFGLDHDGVLKRCVLQRAAPRFSEWYDEDGELQEATNWPKTLKRIHTFVPDSEMQHFVKGPLRRKEVDRYGRSHWIDTGQFRTVRFQKSEQLRHASNDRAFDEVLND